MKPVNQNASATAGKDLPKTGNKLTDAPNGRGTALERVRHLKSGGVYEVLGEATAAVSEITTDERGSLPNSTVLIEGHCLTIYRCVETGRLFCRRNTEFRDGRFQTIAPEAGEDPARLAQALEAAADRSPPSRAATYRRLAAVLRQPGFGEAR